MSEEEAYQGGSNVFHSLRWAVKPLTRERSISSLCAFRAEHHGESLLDLPSVARVIITDTLKRYGAANREILPGVEHRRHKGLNNRAENSHQPTRLREKKCDVSNLPSTLNAFSRL